MGRDEPGNEEKGKMERTEELGDYRKKISELSERDSRERDVYLRKLAVGEILGPLTGFPEIDKVHLAHYAEEDIRQPLPQNTLYHFCLMGENAEKDMFVYFNKTITRKDVLKKIDEISEILVNDYDVGKGDVVTVCLPTMPEAYYIFYALNKIGAIANFIDPRINEERIRECILKNSKLIFAIDKYAEKIEHAALKLHIDVVSISPVQSLSGLYRVLYRIKSGTKGKRNGGIIPFGQFLRGKSQKPHREVLPVRYEKNLIAGIAYTGGTTGIPKGVKLTNENIISVIYQAEKIMEGVQAGDKWLVIMPPFIAYGMVFGLCGPVYTKQKLVLIPNFLPEKFPKIINRYKPNNMQGVPAFFEYLTKSPELRNKDLSYFKYCMVGGDRLNVETEKEINQFLREHGAKRRIVKGYGMSELSSAVANSLGDSDTELGTVGATYMRNKIKIVDLETGVPLRCGEYGELYISAPSRMVGYVDNEEEEKKVFVTDEYGEIWVKTGDIGSVDVRGNITIRSRIKRMIVRSDGHNVFPSIIENLINTHPAIEDCAVIGLRSIQSVNGKIPTAIVVLKPGNEASKEEIKQQLIELQSVKLPPRDGALDFIFTESLPLTSAGKIDFKRLEREYDAVNKVSL